MQKLSKTYESNMQLKSSPKMWTLKVFGVLTPSLKISINQVWFYFPYVFDLLDSLALKIKFTTIWRVAEERQ